MPNLPLQPPDQPVALRRSHLLAPAPDRLTNTPTTLRITRENTPSGRDFSVYQLRTHEEISSPRRSTLLYTVFGRLWSNSKHREIRDADGRPLLELRRTWWRGQWSVKRASGSGNELLRADMQWGIGMKMSVRFENALLLGRWDRDELRNLNLNLNRNHDRSRSEGHRQRLSQPFNYLPRYERLAYERDAPPSYGAVLAEDQRAQLSSASNSTSTSTNTSTSNSVTADSDDSMSDSDSDAEEKSLTIRDCVLPSYDSVHRCSSHSLRDLLDAIEPPEEPAPAPTSSYQPPRPRSEGAVDAKVELKVVQQSGKATAVMLGSKKIIHIQREKVLDYNMSGPMPRWEVEIAEGVDLLMVSAK